MNPDKAWRHDSRVAHAYRVLAMVSSPSRTFPAGPFLGKSVSVGRRNQHAGRVRYHESNDA